MSFVDIINRNIYIINMREKRIDSEREAICRRFTRIIEVELNLSTMEAADRLGYATPSTLYSIKAGKCLPDISKIRKLSEILSISGMRANLDWIFTGYGSPMLAIEKTSRNKIRPNLIKAIDRQSTEKLIATHVLLSK